MGTMWVPPPLLTSFLNCSASLAALDPSLLYCHNEVLFAILVSVRQWKYYCYIICRHHYTAKYSPWNVHHIIRLTLLLAVNSLWSLPLLPANSRRQLTRPQGTTLRNNLTTGHCRSEQKGARGSECESVKKEEQLWSLWWENESLGYHYNNLHLAAIIKEAELNDKHMNFAQEMIRKQCTWLQSTLTLALHPRPHITLTHPRLQIIHSKGNHLIVASTILSSPTVQMFDSLYSSVDDVTARLLTSLFGIHVSVKMGTYPQ